MIPAIVLYIVLAVMGALMVTAMGNISVGGRAVTFGKGAPAAGGKAVKGMAYRSYEGDIAAVDTLTNLTAFGGNAQTMLVPQGAAVLDRISIDMSLDLGAGAVSVRGHCQVRLTGQGFQGSPHDFSGPALSVQGVTSGNAICQGHTEKYGLEIPVVAGGDMQIQGVLIGEDPGDATISVELGFILA